MVFRRAATGAAIAFFVAIAGLACTGAPALAKSDLSCVYASKSEHDTGAFERCAWVDGAGRLHIRREHLRRLTFDRYGLAAVRVGGWYYVRRDGRSAPALPMDTWSDPFVEGLARSPVGAKIGYIDRRLSLVIPARFDGAYPFERGWAVVCTGCMSVSDGEHSGYEGGLWGCIDRHGRTRAPMRARAGYADACRHDRTLP